MNIQAKRGGRGGRPKQAKGGWLGTAAVVIIAIVGWYIQQQQQQQGGGNQNNRSNGNDSALSYELGENRGENRGAVKHWSDTRPRVNLRHVFDGEINRSGKPVGFHARPNGQDPANARLVRMQSKPNRLGVYTATIAVRDGKQWKEKYSTFFPDSMSQEEITQAILAAYKNRRDKRKQPWTGPSGRGFNIQGYTLSGGDINTAFPIYKK